MHDPAEKNLKHRTDVLSWDEVEWTACDLNFRTPESLRLSMSPLIAYAQLVVAAMVSTVAGLIVMITIAPLVGTRSALEAVWVATVLAILIAAGFYRLLPQIAGNQQNLTTATLGFASVVVFYATLRFGYDKNVFAAGILSFVNVAVPWSLFVADQMTGQVIHWLSADPCLDRNEMIVWRNAWCGRFLTEDTDELLNRDVSSASVTVLKRYWQRHVEVGVACVMSVAGGLFGSLAFGYHRVGVAIAMLLTAALIGLTIRTLAATPHSVEIFCQTLGHWFDYQKNERKPPSVMQSPAGSPLLRAFLAYGAAGAFGCGLMWLAFTDATWRTQTIAVATASSWAISGIGVIGAIVVAPLNVLLICFHVSVPVIAVCRDAIEEIRNEE